jgi:hypothetical protein
MRNSDSTFCLTPRPFEAHLQEEFHLAGLLVDNPRDRSARRTVENESQLIVLPNISEAFPRLRRLNQIALLVRLPPSRPGSAGALPRRQIVDRGNSHMAPLRRLIGFIPEI